MSDSVSVADRIDAWLAVRGMTVTQLARLVGVSHSAAWQWRHPDPEKRTRPSTANLEKIAAAFEVSLERFFGPLPATEARAP